MRIENEDLQHIIKDMLTGHFTSADIHIEEHAHIRAIDQLIIGGYVTRSFTDMRPVTKPNLHPKKSLASMVFVSSPMGRI